MRNVTTAKTRSTRLRSVFRKVREIVGRRFPELLKIKLFVGCPETERSHATTGFTAACKPGHSRQYCHWNHVPGFICMSGHFSRELVLDEKYGMLLHEFGHAIADLLNLKNTQDAADGLIMKYFKIPIYYRMPRRIQYVKSLKPQTRDESLKSRFQNWR